MLKHRLISAAVGLAVIIPLIWHSLWGVKALVLFGTMVCLYEFYAMLLRGTPKPLVYVLLGVGFILCLMLMQQKGAGPAYWRMGLVFITMGAFLFGEKELARIPGALGIAFLGYFYCVFAFAHFVFLRAMPQGHLLVFWVLTATFTGDTGAYFVGRSFGKHKLLPRISPGKTWEGFFGQIVFALFGSWAFFLLFVHQTTRHNDVIWIGLICGVLGPLGDLSESMLKRAVGVKDSGSIMPGHGGLLDRVDGLLFTGPAVYYYFVATKNLWGMTP